MRVQEVIIHLPKFIVYANHIVRLSARSDVFKLENPTILNGQHTTSEFAEASGDENNVITGGSFHMELNITTLSHLVWRSRMRGAFLEHPQRNFILLCLDFGMAYPGTGRTVVGFPRTGTLYVSVQYKL